MLGQHPLALFFFLAASSRSVLCQGAPTGIVYVFRGDDRSPEEIRAAGGFLPKGQTTFDDHQGDRSLYNHAKGIGAKSTDEDAYVSTSASELVTTTFVYFEPIAYIYKIHVTPNMIDTVGTLGKYSFDEEAEFAALGGIKFGQIVSWKHWKSKKLGKKVRNIYYNKGKYGSAVAGGVRYDLAGFPPNHPAWDEEPWKSYKPSKRALDEKS
ncbi:Cholera enterotoxin subunit A [Colletotrichum trifolii]|uniref:Cholera enterotoxin subunit A n=1 Tax=Colletotrichum trifolii TaxID=5466 RepID=A0A4R8QNQ1_COLTR|nr:Cholera enterotoxin subunit A [Colletotrichum trifolii]